MSEYLKQLIIQLRAIWDKLNATQKAILVATSAVVMAGMISIIAWSASGGGGADGGGMPRILPRRVWNVDNGGGRETSSAVCSGTGASGREGGPLGAAYRCAAWVSERASG